MKDGLARIDMRPAQNTNKPKAIPACDLRQSWLVRLAALGLLAGMSLSWKTWFPFDRVFPMVPVFGPARFGDAAWPWFSVLSSAMMAVGAILLLWRPRERWAAILLVAAWPLTVIADQMRMQPWAYHYWLIALPLVLWDGRWKEGEILCWKVITVAMYFWAGAGKLVPQFRNLYQHTLVEEWLGKSEGWMHSLLAAGSWGVPLVEILAAVCLLVPKLRRVGVILITLGHVAIFLWIGPTGKNFNVVVWPWNIVAPIMVAILFWPPSKKRAATGNAPSLGWPAVAALVILCGVMPLLSRSGHWDKYLSFQLYSGQSERLIFAAKFPPVGELQTLNPFISKSPHWGEDSNLPREEQMAWQLDVMDWSLQELKVPVPAESRIFQKISKALLEAVPAEWNDDTFFLYRDAPNVQPLSFEYYHRRNFPQGDWPDL